MGCDPDPIAGGVPHPFYRVVGSGYARDGLVEGFVDSLGMVYYGLLGLLLPRGGGDVDVMVAEVPGVVLEHLEAADVGSGVRPLEQAAPEALVAQGVRGLLLEAGVLAFDLVDDAGQDLAAVGALLPGE